MPDAKNNAKLTGDTHLPDVEDMQGEESPASRDVEDEGRAGKGINQAGYLKDKDAPGTRSDKDRP